MDIKFYIFRIKNFKFIFLSVLLIAVFHSQSYAYRPFITEDAGVAGKGVFQLESSCDYLRWQDGKNEIVPMFVPIIGVSDRIELSFEMPYHIHYSKDSSSQSGIGDINIAGKFLLSEENKLRPAFIIKGSIKTKSGNEIKGFGSGDTDYSLALALSKSLKKFAVHVMLGYTFIGKNNDENIRNIYLYGLGIDYSLTEKFHIAAEIAGNKHPDGTISNNPISGLLGTTYIFSKNMALDTGIRIGFNDSTPKITFSIGASTTL